MKPSKAVLIKVGEPPIIVTVDDTVNSISKHIDADGYLERRELFRDKGFIWMHEEGIRLNLPVNKVATLLYNMEGTFAEQFILGAVLITGLDTRGGYSKDVPDSILKRFNLLEAK